MPLTLVNVKKLEKITNKDKNMAKGADNKQDKELDLDYSKIPANLKVQKSPLKQTQKNDE